MKKLLVAAAIGMLFIVILLLTTYNDSGLEVVASDRTVVITNVSKSPIAITDVIINGRLECSRWQQDAYYTPHELHVLWSIGAFPIIDRAAANKKLVASGTGRETLKTGETAYRFSICPIAIVSAKIKTDRSTYDYEFSRQNQ